MEKKLNVLSQKGQEFVHFIEESNRQGRFENVSDMSLLLEPLTEVKVEDGFSLCGEWNGIKGYGQSISLFTEPSETEIILFPHLVIPFTVMGVWQAFLLDVSWTLLPLIWHANYFRRSYLFDKESVDKILKEHKLYMPKLYADVYIPSVKIWGDDAEVKVLYWSEFQGLILQKKVIERSGKSVRITDDKLSILKNYHCGVIY